MKVGSLTYSSWKIRGGLMKVLEINMSELMDRELNPHGQLDVARAALVRAVKERKITDPVIAYQLLAEALEGRQKNGIKEAEKFLVALTNCETLDAGVVLLCRVLQFKPSTGETLEYLRTVTRHLLRYQVDRVVDYVTALKTDIDRLEKIVTED